MFGIKKIDSYIFKRFFTLFLMTFLICIFILLMQFLWKHVSELVGKGIGWSVLAEFFIYAVFSLVPLALPLAILLASLMTFGNLGENFELTAMKAAGISLFRIMRPLIIFISMVCVGAFYFSNNGVNIYVRGKEKGLLKDLMIYDFSGGFDNATVMVSDSGRVQFTADNKYLLLSLYDGESFENLKKQRLNSSSTSVPYRRETFKTKEMLLDFDTEFNRFDESLLQDQHVSKNIKQLSQSIDSVSKISNTRRNEQAKELINRHYLGREEVAGRMLNTNIKKKKMHALNADSLFLSLNQEEMVRASNTAIEKAKAIKDLISYNKMMLDEPVKYVRRHQIEWHRKFTLSFACLIFFFIGAPLGAIIRKGGLGMPVVISVIMFIFYYIIDNTGFKMAREGLWTAYQGIWLSSAVLLPIGVFLTYKAVVDATLLNPEQYIRLWGFIKRKTHSIFTK